MHFFIMVYFFFIKNPITVPSSFGDVIIIMNPITRSPRIATPQIFNVSLSRPNIAEPIK